MAAELLGTGNGDATQMRPCTKESDVWAFGMILYVSWSTFSVHIYHLELVLAGTPCA